MFRPNFLFYIIIFVFLGLLFSDHFVNLKSYIPILLGFVMFGMGVTIDLSRSFVNGTKFGVFASFTDVSTEQFGEGSFDKGIYFFTLWNCVHRNSNLFTNNFPII